jgi:hypothetical protein
MRVCESFYRCVQAMSDSWSGWRGKSTMASRTRGPNFGRPGIFGFAGIIIEMLAHN